MADSRIQSHWSNRTTKAKGEADVPYSVLRGGGRMCLRFRTNSPAMDRK
jgi:hypothetical protein